MGKQVHTSFFITESVKIVAQAISERTGIKYKRLQKIMLDEFFKGEKKVDPRFENRCYSSPDFIKRTVREHIILSEEDYNRLSELADELNVKRSSILFQSMLDYCSVCAMVLWTKEEFAQLFVINEKHEYDVD